MPDTVFRTIIPPLKAVDNGDGTYSVSVVVLNPAAGTDSTFEIVYPPLKAIDNGDGTYLLPVEVM
jgi:hypothetical protein